MKQITKMWLIFALFGIFLVTAWDTDITFQIMGGIVFSIGGILFGFDLHGKED